MQRYSLPRYLSARFDAVLAPARAAAAATPATRDRYADLLRVASILVVVLGHWLMVAVTRSGGQVTGDNALGAIPWARLATWVLQVMPVFFFVGGFSNLVTWEATRRRGAGYAEYLSGRMLRLLHPVLAFALAWLAIPVLLELLGLPPEQVVLVGKFAAQPLWFLGVYLLVTALAPVMVGLHRRFRLWVPATLAAGAATVDAARLLLGLDAAGYLNLLLVWALVQQLGFFYADGSLRRLSRRTLALLAVAALAVLAALTGSGRYPVSMVGLPGEELSNMNPPTFCIVALAAWQVALLELARPRVSAWLARSGPWTAVIFVGSMAMTLYLWHLTALVVLVGLLLAARAPLPEAGSALWWLSRPLWLAALVVVLAPLALVASRFERPARGGPPPAATPARAVPLATALGLLYGALGLLGFVAGGFAPLVRPRDAAPPVLPADPLQSLLHLLLGVYLVRVAHAGSTGRPLPWLVTAAGSLLGLPAAHPLDTILHGGTFTVALAMALRPPARPAGQGSDAVPDLPPRQ